MKKNSMVFLFGMLILLLVACSSKNVSQGDNSKQDKDSKISIKIAHVEPEDTTPHLKFEKFKEIIEEKSNGRFEVEIYPNSQMGGEREIIEAVQMGSLQMASPAVGQLGNFLPDMQVFDLPFLFKDTETAYNVLDGEVGTELLGKLDSYGFLGLGYGENGWRHLTTAEGPIISPDQIKGLKLRTMEVPLHLAFWKELGANPSPLAFSELYSALQQGVIDAQENPLYVIDSVKLYEVNPYVTETGHIYDPVVFIVNKQFYESLSKDDQKIYSDAVKESIDYQRELNKDLEDDIKTALKEKGVKITELTPEQKEVWVEGVKSVYEKHADEVGRDTLIKVLEAANNEVALKSLKK